MENQTSEIRAQKWAEIVIACNRSGEPKTAWCEEHGVNRKSFYYWQSKLRKQAAGLAPATNSIVPLRITGSQKEETANQELPAFAERAIRIQMQGLEIVIPAESSPAYVAALAKALVNPQCWGIFDRRRTSTSYADTQICGGASTGWQASWSRTTIWIRAAWGYSFSAGSVGIASKHFCGNRTALCCFTNDCRTAVCLHDESD